MPQIIKHAVLIGINDVPNMEYLDTPSHYAIQMQNWAKEQGYKTSLFVDSPNGEASGICSRTEILKTIRSIIEHGTDQLLIYFSGHGVEHTAGNDIWLLPDYQDDPSECISISLNRALAYNSGISHVIFISDACRVPSNHQSLRAASGGSILPMLNIINPDTEVDVLYSTWPGQLAVDIKDEHGNYRSIYSDCLLSCLQGDVPEVIKQIQNITPGFPAVLPDELNRYLKKTVPVQTLAAGRKPQIPMGDVTSRDPRYLSSFLEDNAEVLTEESTILPEVIPQVTAPAIKTVTFKLESFMEMRGINVESKIHNATFRFSSDHEFFTSPNVFGSPITGLLVTGINKPAVFSKREVDLKNGNKRNFSVPQIIASDEVHRDFEEENDDLFLIGNPRTNRFYPVSLLTGFFTQVVFEKGELLTVNYFPTSGYRKVEAHNLGRELVRRKTIIIMAAKNGIFQGSEEIAEYLRSYKHLDPTLGLFAAYAYFQKGDFEGVRSVYSYMAQEPEQVIGDVKILNRLSTNRGDLHYSGKVNLPILTEGWSYLKLLPENPYTDLSTELQPGLWTSFTRNGLQYLIDNQNYRRI